MKIRFIALAIGFAVLCCAAHVVVAVGAEANEPTTSDNTQKGPQKAPRAGLEEVVITAQKRAQPLKDVPISVVAISADALKEGQITSLDDLPYAVPDLAYSSAGNSHYFEIRGMSNLVGIGSLIGIYIDDTDVTLAGSADIQINPVAYDLQRVEVLRGPQGTLYGEGSAGGTVRFITNDPNLSGFAFGADVATMLTENGGPSQRINSMVNVPLIPGTLGLRIAGSFEHDGGWIDEPAANLQNINSQNRTNVRIKSLWRPSSRLSVTAMAIINRFDGGWDFSDANAPGQFTQVFGLTTVPRVKNNYNIDSLTVTYDFASGAQIFNTLGYLNVSAPQFGVPAYFQISVPPQYADYYIPLQDINDHLLTDELHLTSTGTGPWQWMAGAFFRRYTDAIASPVNYYGIPGPVGMSLPEPYASSTKTLDASWSVFGSTSYRLWDRLTIGGGVRLYQDRQHFNDFVATTEQAGNFHSVDPRADVLLKVTQDVNVYASAAKGFRSGGFNSFGQPPYEPEDVWTYELGSKMSFPGSRMSLDADVFWSNYSNYQTFAPLPGAELVSAIQNVGRAKIKGIEADWAWSPLAHWRLEARADYLNARFTEIDATSTAYLPGDPIDLVPRYQITVSPQFNFTWFGRPVFSRLDYSQQGPETYRNRSSGPWYYNESDVIHMLNFNTSLQWSESLTLSVFARNLLNDDGFANPFSIIGNGVRPRPRTIGFEFSVSLE